MVVGSADCLEATSIKNRIEFSSKNWLILACLSAIVGLVSTFAIEYFTQPGRILHAPDKWIVDWQILAVSDHLKTQRSDLALVYITEKSLAQYPYISPTNRSLLASVIEDLNQAQVKAIGLDFIFDRSTDPTADNELIQAIKNSAAPVVIGVVDNRTPGQTTENLAFQEEFLSTSGAKAGHVYFQRVEYFLYLGDDNVRSLVGTPPGLKFKESFSKVLADEVAQNNCNRCEGLIAWQVTDWKSNSRTFMTMAVPTHSPSIATSDGVGPLPSSFLKILKGRVVIVGSRRLYEDQHRTPLTLLSGELTSGTFIHAQALAQRLDGRSIIEVSKNLTRILSFIAGSLGFLIAVHFKRWWLSLGAGLLMFILSFLALRVHMVVIPPSIFVAWGVGLQSGKLFVDGLSRLSVHRKAPE